MAAPKPVAMPEPRTAIAVPETARMTAETARMHAVRAVSVVDHDVTAMAGRVCELANGRTDQGAAQNISEPIVMIRPR